MTSTGEITDRLLAIRSGDRRALDQLVPLVYARLREMAHARLRGQGPGASLDTTSLVHEAYLKLVDRSRAGWNDRAHFFAVAATLMRQIVVDRRSRWWMGRDVFGSGRTIGIGRSTDPAARPGARRAGDAGMSVKVAAPAILAVAGLIACAGGPLVPSPVETPRFDGIYAIDIERSFEHSWLLEAAEGNEEMRRRIRVLERFAAEPYAHLEIAHGVIRAGSGPVQEFSVQTATVHGDTFRGRAVWHEDVGDPGDSIEVNLLLRLQDGALEFSLLDETGAVDQVYWFARAKGAP